MNLSSLDAAVDAWVGPAAAKLSAAVFYSVTLFGSEVPLIVLWLAVAALYFTLYFRFINFRALGLAFRHVRGDFSDAKARGEISHFKAVTTAISGTVGVGNIGGVGVIVV